MKKTYCFVLAIFCMGFSSWTTVNASQMSYEDYEKEYNRMAQDFASGGLLDHEALSEESWKAGRCVPQGDPTKLYASIFKMFKGSHGRYYRENFLAILYSRMDIAPNSFDDKSTAYLDEQYGPHNILPFTAVMGTNSTLVEMPIPDSEETETFYIRSFEDEIIVALGNEDASKAKGICYFFIDVSD